jgi:hypothetical protein
MLQPCYEHMSIVNNLNALCDAYLILHSPLANLCWKGINNPFNSTSFKESSIIYKLFIEIINRIVQPIIFPQHIWD